MFMEKENPRSFIHFSFKATFYVDMDQSIHKGKMKAALN